MSVITIPMADAAELGAYYFTAELEGRDYRFNFQYNDRDGFWYFDLLDVEGNRIRSGIKVVANFSLLLRVASLNRPPGMLLVIDTRSNPTDPTLEELGVEVALGYIHEDQLP